LLAGIANITAIVIQNLAVINNPTYVPQTWHVTLLMIAMLTIQGKNPTYFPQNWHRAYNVKASLIRLAFSSPSFRGSSLSLEYFTFASSLSLWWCIW
jgi:hypothetical protein